MSKSHLQGLRSSEFVYPLMVISNPKVWLVMEKIDSPKIHDNIDVVRVANEMKPCGVKNLPSTTSTPDDSYGVHS